MQADTRSDQNGRFVLSFGALQSPAAGGAALEAAFSARKPPRYELKPADVRKRVLAYSVPDDIVKEDDAPESDVPIYPGQPVTMNFKLHPRQ